MSTKTVPLVLLTICLIAFTAGAQRGGGHGGGGGGGHAGGGGGGHVSAGGGGARVSAGGGGVRSGGFTTQAYRGGGVAGARVGVGRAGGYAGFRGYGYRSPYSYGGIGYYGGYYPGYYGCYSYYDCYGTPSVSYGYAAPAVDPPGLDYYPQQYAAPPPPQGYYAEPAPRQAPAPTPTTLTLLAFKDHSIQIATAYTFDRGSITYVNENGIRKAVPADQLDFDTTRKLNTDRGVPFDPK
jgi:hypothetical protein